MKIYAGRLIAAIEKKGNPCIVGLDPRLEMMPDFATSCQHEIAPSETIRLAITNFNQSIIEAVEAFIPAVKLQIAFYEQYGLPGLQAFEDSVRTAKDFGLIVIVDAKRNDISTTAAAYANAYLGRSNIFGNSKP